MGSKPVRKELSREELAAIEVGHTEIRPGVARALTAFFLAIVFGVPLLQMILEPSDGDPAIAKASMGSGFIPTCSEALKILPSMEELWKVRGLDSLSMVNQKMLRRINDFETNLDDQSILQRTLVTPTQWVLTGMLRAGNEKAYCGRDRWLFYRPGIDYITGHGFLDPDVLRKRNQSGNEWTAPPQPDPVKGIVHFKKQLEARGIELIVMPTPVKPMLHPEMFSARFADRHQALQNPSYSEFEKRLAAEGVRVFDPSSHLMALKKQTQAPVYLETDTHWTPSGMQGVAVELSRYIRHLSHTLSNRKPVSFLRRKIEVENMGDVAGMLKLPEDQDFYQPQRVSIQKVLQPNGTEWKPDPEAEILLLGDSFSNIYSLKGMNWGEGAGLAEQLSFELQCPLDRIVINDHGAHASRRILANELFRDGERLQGKALVIWQFAIRELSEGDWQLIELKSGPRRKTVETSTSPAELMVTGSIKSIGTPPRPGQVPYKDAVTAIHLKNLRIANGKLPSETILVYAWVMRDNKLTRAARFKPGQDMTVRLIPWNKVQSKYGRYNRMELTDPETLLLDVYWATLEK